MLPIPRLCFDVIAVVRIIKNINHEDHEGHEGMKFDKPSNRVIGCAIEVHISNFNLYEISKHIDWITDKFQ